MQRFFVFVLFMPLLAWSQKPAYEINGSVSGFPEGTEVKILNANDNSELSSSKISSGKFTIRGSVDEPILCKLAIGSETPVYLP